MKTLAVYPFDFTKGYFKKRFNLIKGYEKVFLISLSNLDEDKQHKNYEITKDWKKAIDKSETLLILPGLNNIDKYKEIIAYAETMKKKVIVSKELSQLVDEKDGVNVIKNNGWKSTEPEYLHEISVPVITVMSLGENSGKFELQLALGEYFKSEGYNVIQYGSSEVSEFFGIKQLPNFMYKEYSLVKKVKLLNQYIYEEVQENKPDIIIIGCAGGIMPYNRYVHNYYAEIPIIVSKALEIDINLLVLYFDKRDTVNEQFIDAIEVYCKENFGCETNMFTMSNVYVNYDREKSRQEYLCFDDKTVNQNILNFSNKLFDKNDSNELLQVFSGIEDILKTDFEVI
ncbi:MAG: TIGR04066 family peptide maturation system protein [Eubacterium sp.]